MTRTEASLSKPAAGILSKRRHAMQINGEWTAALGVAMPYAPHAQFVAHMRREPVGVVAAIVPRYVPLLAAAWKAGPLRCTVVLRPAAPTPLTVLVLDERIGEAGAPPGVVNVVTGNGLDAGALLVCPAGVDKIRFTGSTELGKLM